MTEAHLDGGSLTQKSCKGRVECSSSKQTYKAGGGTNTVLMKADVRQKLRVIGDLCQSLCRKQKQF